jgi:hypothetical protein
MPILTTELIKASQQMEEGWTKLRLVEAKTPVKDGFTNEELTFEGVAGPGNGSDNADRRIRHTIYGKGLSASNPVADVIDNMLRLIAALEDISMAEVKKMTGEYSFANKVDTVVWGEVKLNVRDGKTYRQIVAWAPADVQPF